MKFIQLKLLFTAERKKAAMFIILRHPINRQKLVHGAVINHSIPTFVSLSSSALRGK